jgi:hypothetical protein
MLVFLWFQAVFPSISRDQTINDFFTLIHRRFPPTKPKSLDERSISFKNIEMRYKTRIHGNKLNVHVKKFNALKSQCNTYECLLHLYTSNKHKSWVPDSFRYSRTFYFNGEKEYVHGPSRDHDMQRALNDCMNFELEVRKFPRITNSALQRLKKQVFSKTKDTTESIELPSEIPEVSIPDDFFKSLSTFKELKISSTMKLSPLNLRIPKFQKLFRKNLWFLSHWRFQISSSIWIFEWNFLVPKYLKRRKFLRISQLSLLIMTNYLKNTKPY